MSGVSALGKIYIAGHQGLVGRALVRALAARGITPLTAPRAELDLRDGPAVAAWFARHRPDAVILAAATVGGIWANNTRPAEFLYDNLAIATNVLMAAHRADVPRVLYLGSSCIYPRDAAQPIREDALLTGPLEPTNQWYAIAKIAGLKLTQALRAQYGRDYIAAMPCNLYGPGDNFDPVSAHVLPALMQRMHQAKLAGAPEFTLWGSGAPRREFLHVDDLAQALLLLLEQYHAPEIINIGVGADISILELAQMIRAAVGYAGRFVHDTSKPDGTPRKLLDSTRIRSFGWQPAISLAEGIERTYAWFCEHEAPRVA